MAILKRRSMCNNPPVCREWLYKYPYKHALYIKVNDNIVLIVCLYVDDLIFTGNNPKTFEEFKRKMCCEFEMTDLGFISYYLGIEVKQTEEGIFIVQENYAKELLQKFNMSNCNPVNTPEECNIKLSRYDDGAKVDPTLFRSLVGSLRYLTCIRPDILFGVGLVSRCMEAPTTTHLKAAKKILHYIKGTLDFELHYYASNVFRLRGFSDSDWGGDIDDRKSTSGFVFYMGNTAFTWSSKKQPAVTLSACEVEYVAVSFCVTQVVWLRNLLNKLHFTQREHIEVNVNNKSVIVLAKNPLFHECSKHIDTKYHFVHECIANKVLKINFVKSQDQIRDILTKSLELNTFKALRSLLGASPQLNRKSFPPPKSTSISYTKLLALLKSLLPGSINEVKLSVSGKMKTSSDGNLEKGQKQLDLKVYNKAITTENL
ncbi:uncharacterized protein LOC111400170 [Olea europaea var. sylvestris]|uniref:uncharacterized protein LOC111400170 n=1 Tax=Olea europaea var. sylvestris TaxID=158386 RepID=UPI000C1CDFE2|nr:uncharacterized protein LOC111400170 [Olea europaea var. sylvestris]